MKRNQQRKQQRNQRDSVDQTLSITQCLTEKIQWVFQLSKPRKMAWKHQHLNSKLEEVWAATWLLWISQVSYTFFNFDLIVCVWIICRRRPKNTWISTNHRPRYEHSHAKFWYWQISTKTASYLIEQTGK